MKNNFEQHIKESLDNFEMPYKEGAWESFEKNLSPSTPFYKSKWFMGGAAITIIALVSIATYLTSPTKESTSNTAKNNLSSNDAAIEKLAKNTIKKENSAIPSEQEVKTAPINNSGTENLVNTEVSNKTEKNNKTTKLPKITVVESSSKILKKEDPVSNPKVNPKEIPSGKTDETFIKKPLIVQESEMISANFFLEKAVCQGSTINLSTESVNANHQYIWTINHEANLTILNGNNISYLADKAGIETIQLSITEKGKVIATKTSTIKVMELPSTNIEINNNEFSIVNEYQFTNFDNSNTITWNFGDDATSDNPSVKHSFKKAGTYKCEYLVTSPNGCSVKAEKTIDVKGYYNIRTDYGFSPNGDNLNDVFVPEELKTINRPFEMNIYSRNGQLLYTTKNIDKPWDGTTLDGTKTSFGSYVWVISINNELGVDEVYKGTITNVSN